MHKNIREGLLFILGALLVFIGGMVAIDKINTAVDIDVETRSLIRPENTTE